MYPEIFGSRTWAMRPEEKCLSGFGVGRSRGSRASVGVDCFVPCPPSVAPRIGFRV